MGIWIRTQDRDSLIEIVGIYIFEGYQRGIIKGTDIRGKVTTLGKYSTVERADEILNEIQNKITKGRNKIRNAQKIERRTNEADI